MKVYLMHDDIDRHAPGCDCGNCNSNGKSYGCGIYYSSNDENIETVYAPSDVEAENIARNLCKKNRYEIER